MTELERKPEFKMCHDMGSIAYSCLAEGFQNETVAGVVERVQGDLAAHLRIAYAFQHFSSGRTIDVGTDWGRSLLADYRAGRLRDADGSAVILRPDPIKEQFVYKRRRGDKIKKLSTRQFPLSTQFVPWGFVVVTRSGLSEELDRACSVPFAFLLPVKNSPTFKSGIRVKLPGKRLYFVVVDNELSSRQANILVKVAGTYISPDGFARANVGQRRRQVRQAIHECDSPEALFLPIVTAAETLIDLMGGPHVKEIWCRGHALYGVGGGSDFYKAVGLLDTRRSLQ